VEGFNSGVKGLRDSYILYQYGRVTVTICSENIVLIAQLFSPRSDLSGNTVGQDREFIVTHVVK
jgi:hypothetical protein